MCKGFLSATDNVDGALQKILLKLPQNEMSEITEIRLRAGAPLSVIMGGEIYFLRGDGTPIKCYTEAIKVTSEQINSSIRLITHNSLYSHTDEIGNGFISMPLGNRAGICGVFRGGKFAEATSLNIRIAHECLGVADRFIKEYSGGSYLLCGPPASGKTTLLRDFLRGLSNGEGGRFYKISLIDTRCEIAACFGGVPQNNVGVNTDIISGRDKALGAEAAVRSMSPDILAFDEIGTEQELTALENSVNCGTYIITTAHIGSVEELLKRNVTRRLISSVVDKVIFLPFVKAPPIEVNVRNGELCL